MIQANNSIRIYPFNHKEGQARLNIELSKKTRWHHLVILLMYYTKKIEYLINKLELCSL